MTSIEWAVLAGGALLIAWVNWYFFAPRRAVAAAGGAGGAQEVEILVQGGYAPDRIEVVTGRPVRLTFVRKESNPCSEELVIPAFGIRRALTPNRPTTVEFTPPAPGRYEFTCGMGMLRGEVIASEGDV
jgi:plastocyanin domain-containing protein